MSTKKQLSEDDLYKIIGKITVYRVMFEMPIPFKRFNESLGDISKEINIEAEDLKIAYEFMIAKAMKNAFYGQGEREMVGFKMSQKD